MRRFALLLFFAGLAGAEVRSICVEDRAGLSSFSLKAFRDEIRELLSTPELAVISRPCVGPAVSLVIAAHPPARYASALGLAHRKGERIFPQLEIYTQPVRRMIGEQASAAQLGRALARVAAHELGHYLHQQLDHEDRGLMRASFDRDQLNSTNATPLRSKAIR